MTSDTAVVTGATGFIAIELIKQLLQKGYHVKGTHRASADASRLADVTALARATPGSLELLQADLLKPGAFDDIVKGATFVFHTASPVISSSSAPYEEIVQPAVDGVKNVLGSVLKSNDSVKRTVLTSSGAAVRSRLRPAPPSNGNVYSEQDCNTSSVIEQEPYFVAKSQQEEAAWSFAKEHGLDLVVINPTFVLGPATSAHSISTLAKLKDVLNGGQQELQFGQGAVTDVRDVARAHVLAAETPAAKGRYIVSSAFAFTPKQALAVLHKALPQYEINSPAPERPARQLFDNSKVQNELGLKLTPPEQSLVDAAESLIKLGLSVAGHSLTSAAPTSL